MESMRKAWKYLEDQFDVNFKELRTREEETGNREKRLEEKLTKLQGFDKLIQRKGKEYDAMEKAITEKRLQVEQAKAELKSISLLVEEKKQEFESKEKQVLEVDEVLREKKRECSLIENSIKEGKKDWSRVEKNIREMYIRVKTSIEARVVAFVEARLGEPFREGGPMLGLEFDPLPSHAFGSSKATILSASTQLPGLKLVQLERMKEELRSPAPSPVSNVKQEGQRKRKRANSNSSASTQF